MTDLPAASPAPPGRIERGTRAFFRTNLALFSAGFATFGLLYCVQPLLPEFSAEFGVSAASSSLALSLTTGVLSVALLAAAGVSELAGRKPVMVASLLSSALLCLAMAALPGWTGILAARALMGVTLSGLPAVAMTYVTEEMHPRSVGLAMGLYVGGSGLGGMAGRLLTGVLTDLAGWRAALAAIGVLGVAAGLVFWRSLPPSRHFIPRPGSVPGAVLRGFAPHLRDQALPWLFLLGFLLMGGFVCTYNFIGYRLLAPPFGLSQSVVGLIFSVYLVGIAASTVTGELAGRLGRPRVLVGSLVAALVGVGLTASGELVMIVAGVVLLTAGFFGGHSVASAWVGARARQKRAQASSLYLLAYYGGSSLVGSLGGVFWDRTGWEGVAGLAGALIAAGLLVSLRLAALPSEPP